MPRDEAIGLQHKTPPHNHIKRKGQGFVLVFIRKCDMALGCVISLFRRKSMFMSVYLVTIYQNVIIKFEFILTPGRFN